MNRRIWFASLVGFLAWPAGFVRGKLFERSRCVDGAETPADKYGKMLRQTRAEILNDATNNPRAGAMAKSAKK